MTRLVDIKSKKELVLSFPYAEEVVNAVREISGRKWDKKKKLWNIPLGLESLKALNRVTLKYSFEYTERAKREILAVINTSKQLLELSKATDGDIEVVELEGELRPFQKAGVAYAAKARRCFIADEPGLGKTLEALATLQTTQSYPALVVCPATLKLNWERESKKWFPKKTVSIFAANSISVDISIINYDILKKHVDELKKRNFKAVIFDESHYAKSHKSQRTAACKKIAKKVPYVLCLTGTPVLSRPRELLSQLTLLGRLEDLGGFWYFAKTYCNAHRGYFGWDLSGAKNLERLNKRLRQICFIRRLKKDVMKELPEKQRSYLPVEIDNRKEYDQANKALISWLREQSTKDEDFIESLEGLSAEERKTKREERADDAEEKARNAEQLVRIEALKQLVAKGKLKAIKDWIGSFLETGQKLVVFAHHKKIQKVLLEAFPKSAQVLGEDSLEERQESIDRFQNDAMCRLIICSLQAGGLGITLTAASNVLFVELGWTPAVHDQAEDRCYRIGQRNQVTAWYLLGKDTIDEEIYVLIEEKRRVVESAVDGVEYRENKGILEDLVVKLSR